jgi:hypothetical protein
MRLPLTICSTGCTSSGVALLGAAVCELYIIW